MPEAVGYKMKGEDVLYLVDLGDGLIRPFDQTGGSTSITSDDLEVSTKDRTGVDYGDITEVRSFEGDLVHGDPFIKSAKRAIRNKRFIEIYEVNLITKEAEKGIHKVNTFDLSYDHGDFATYSLDASLFGDVEEIELTEIPEGAPPLELGENTEGGAEG